MANSLVGTRISAEGQRRARMGNALEQRQRERRRLAGSGCRLAQEIAACQQRRDRLPLDRRGLFIAQRIERGQQGGFQAQRRKAWRKTLRRCFRRWVCGVVFHRMNRPPVWIVSRKVCPLYSLLLSHSKGDFLNPACARPHRFAQ